MAIYSRYAAAIEAAVAANKNDEFLRMARVHNVFRN